MENSQESTAKKKPWWHSLTINAAIFLVFLGLFTATENYWPVNSITRQIIHKVMIDSGAIAVLILLAGGLNIFGRIRIGDLNNG